MIDAVLNSLTGPVIVHDEIDLEGASALLVDEGGRCAVMRADGTLKPLARGLDTEMRRAFSSVPECDFIRMEGRRVMSRRPVTIASRAA